MVPSWVLSQVQRPAVSGLTLPVIVQTSAFISEVDVTNFSSQARTVNFSFVADAITTADKTAQLQY